jgi:hypothetical protein
MLEHRFFNKLLSAGLFHNRGTASPEFLWLSRVATAVLFGGFVFAALRYTKFQTDRKSSGNHVKSC